MSKASKRKGSSSLVDGEGEEQRVAKSPSHQMESLARPPPLKLQTSKAAQLENLCSDSESYSKPEDKTSRKTVDEYLDEQAKEEEHQVSAVKNPEPLLEENKVKVASLSKGETSASKQFQRKWTHEDEKILLQAISEFNSSRKRLPTRKDYGLILPLLEGKLSFIATADQAKNKLRSLKRKFNSKVYRKKKFTPEQRVIFDLCKKLWGGGEASSDKRETQVNGNGIDGRMKVKKGLKYPYLNEVVEELSNQGLGLYYKDAFTLLNESDAEEFELMFKNLKKKKGILNVRKIELMSKFSRVLSKQ